MASVGHFEWFKQLPCAVTICDKNYMILYMNDKAAEVNSKEGGEDLVGKNLMDCHPPEAQEKLKKVMASGRPNVYTTERRAAKKLVYQCHWKKRDGWVGSWSYLLNFPVTYRTL